MLTHSLRNVFLFGFLLFPASVSAETLFTEIMYDLPGSDSGREWVEFQNTGSEPLDVTGWKFFENDVNHRVTAENSAIVPSGGYAVIVANIEKFRADWPGFSGILLKSSFSLNNTGESLILKNPAGANVAALSYSATAADGDGNSLNLTGGEWFPRKPTPGGALSLEKVVPPPKTSRNPAPSTKVSTYDSAGTAGAVSNLGAAAVSGTASQGRGPGMVPWVAALIAVISIVVAAVFLTRRKSTRSGYTITEEKE